MKNSATIIGFNNAICSLPSFQTVVCAASAVVCDVPREGGASNGARPLERPMKADSPQNAFFLSKYSIILDRKWKARVLTNLFDIRGLWVQLLRREKVVIFTKGSWFWLKVHPHSLSLFFLYSIWAYNEFAELNHIPLSLSLSVFLSSIIISLCCLFLFPLSVCLFNMCDSDVWFGRTKSERVSIIKKFFFNKKNLLHLRLNIEEEKEKR